MSKRKAFQSVGERLAHIRRQRGMSQGDLARKLGVTQPNISDYERGVYVPNATTILRLAEILGTSADELLGTKPLRQKGERDEADRRLWKRFQRVRELPERDQRAILRMINNALVAAKGNGEQGARRSKAAVGS